MVIHGPSDPRLAAVRDQDSSIIRRIGSEAALGLDKLRNVNVACLIRSQSSPALRVSLQQRLTLFSVDLLVFSAHLGHVSAMLPTNFQEKLLKEGHFMLKVAMHPSTSMKKHNKPVQ